MRYPSVPIKVNLTFLQQLGMLRTRTNLLTLKQINIFHVKIFSLLYFCISHILYFYEKRCHVSKKENYNNKNIILLWPYLVSNVTGLNWKRLSHFKKDNSYKANLLFSYSFASNVQKVKNSQNDRFATVWVEFSVALVFSPQVTQWSPCLRDFQNWKSYFVTGDKDEEKCDL